MSGVRSSLRREVSERAVGRCEYCSARENFSPTGFHCEHVIAVQHGGQTELRNLALACPACNFRKGPNLSARDPENGVVVRIFDPRRDIWTEHFEMDGGRITGKSAIGRATGWLLQFNSPERVAARDFEQRIPG